MKTCTKCGEEKQTIEFSKHTRARDGLQCECKACARIANSKWRASNPEKAKSIRARHRAANPDNERAMKANWERANPEASRIRSHNYRARKRENGGKLSRGIAAKLFRLQRGKCACCGEPLGTEYHLDHIMPLALGGSNTDDNIQILRSTCNQQKHARHPIEFMQQRGFLL